MREKSQILVSHTGNTSIFAFAAEIEAHADLYNELIFEDRLVIANMSISNYANSDFANTAVQYTIAERVGEQVQRHSSARYQDLLNEGLVLGE